MAKHRIESLAGTERLMEEVCERENCKQALRRVKANQGSPGVDGMTVDELPEYRKQHGLKIGEQLRNGTYQPQPVRRVEIPKPDGPGVRQLGIPCVLDRFVQQAVLQVLQKRWDPTFSEPSHGFRPGRSAQLAVHEAQQYIAEVYRWVVDLDLEKFFDRVNHDRLVAAVAERVADKRMLKLIRAFLEAGVMEDGLVSPGDEGTPQGGPLRPQGHRSLSGEDSGTDTSNPWHQSDADGHTDRDLPAGMARILRRLSNALGVANPCIVATPSTSVGGVEAMETGTDAISRASQTGHQ